MTIYTEISYRDMEPSPRLDALVKKRVGKLEMVFNQISACRVTIEAPHKHKLRGNLFHVRVDMSAPQAELVASRDVSVRISHEQIDVAVRDAFSAIRRQLQKHKEKLRVDYHIPDKLPTGVIREIFPYDDYGIILSADGREIYFHRNSVVSGNFDRLRIGDELRYNEELGTKGPQASTVHFSRHGVSTVHPEPRPDESGEQRAL